MALNRMEAAPMPIHFHLVDVIASRPVSNKIAEIFAVHHESPQLLVIHRGECVYEVSHLEIKPADILKEIEALNF